MVNILQLFIKILLIFECALGRISKLDGFLYRLFRFGNKILLDFFKLTHNIFAREIDLKNVLI